MKMQILRLCSLLGYPSLLSLALFVYRSSAAWRNVCIKQVPKDWKTMSKKDWWTHCCSSWTLYVSCFVLNSYLMWACRVGKSDETRGVEALERLAFQIPSERKHPYSVSHRKRLYGRLANESLSVKQWPLSPLDLLTTPERLNGLSRAEEMSACTILLHWCLWEEISGKSGSGNLRTCLGLLSCWPPKQEAVVSKRPSCGKWQA